MRLVILAAVGLAAVLCVPAWGQEKAAPKPPPDLFSATLIPAPAGVDLSAKTVRYRVTAVRRLPDFPETGRQTFKRLDDTTGEVTVRKDDEKPPAKETLPVKPTGEAERQCLEPSFYLESDSAIIRKLAADALAGETDAAKAAGKLEAFVAAHITEKTLAIGGLVTARQVAESRKGDCRQHAVLLAALARAAGLPSRVVGGVVYVERFAGRERVFGYHLWTEMFVGGAWRPYDAAMHPRGGFGAGHLALLRNDLNGFNAELQLGLGLIDAVGNLRIEVIEQTK
jgi:transglutaminase-like putative cysteine protease